MTPTKSIVPIGKIQQMILFVHGEKVIIDADIAVLYGVPTKHLNEQFKRNKERFPDDFMFHLSPEEKAEVVANCDHLSKLKFSKALPYTFSDHGTIMASSVLNSQRALEVSILLVRAFVQLRRFISKHKELSRKISQLNVILRITTSKSSFYYKQSSSWAVLLLCQRSDALDLILMNTDQRLHLNP